MTYWQCDPQSPLATVPIGKPINNIRLYVLDAKLQPVPIGVAGQLYICGVGLARGYLGNSELTHKSFIANPFATEEDKQLKRNLRLYATGDLVRYLSDGNIEYLGRMDHQVKIRGLRIECGEIENVLKELTELKDVAVIAREDEARQKHLVAYVVARQAIEDNEKPNKFTQWRDYLGQKLPEYMIPNYFLVLEKLPLNVNGKLDRKLLPNPGNVYRLTNTFVAPRVYLENALVEIWSTVLNISADKISVSDNFFEVGGNSLLAFTLVKQIQEKLNPSIKLASLFNHPTIEQLVQNWVQPTVEEIKIPAILPIKTQGDKTPLFLIHPAGGLALSYLGLAASINRPLYGIQNPRFGQDHGYNSLEEMADDYLQSLRKVQPKGPYYLGGWSFGGTIALIMAQRLQELNEKVEQVILIDTINAREDLAQAMQFSQEDIDQYIVEEAKRYGFALNSNWINAIKSEFNRVPILLSTTNIPRYNGKVHLLKAQQIESQLEKIVDNYNGWQGFLPNLDITNVNGKHSNLFDDNHIAEFSLALNEVLEINTNNNLNSKVKDYLTQLQEQETLICIQSGKKTPLFLVHAASGLAFPYFNLETLNDRAIYAINNPYFGKDSSFTSIEHMAKAYISFIKSIQPSGPYYLGGWSLGGVVALEMAQQLRRLGEEILDVIMLDSVNPQDRPADDNPVNLSAEDAIKKLRIEANSPTAHAIREQYRTAIALLRKYNPNAYNGRVYLLKANIPNQPAADPNDLQQWEAARFNDPANGWSMLIPNIAVQPVNGSHDNLLNVEEAREITIHLQKRFDAQRYSLNQLTKHSNTFFAPQKLKKQAHFYSNDLSIKSLLQNATIYRENEIVKISFSDEKMAQRFQKNMIDNDFDILSIDKFEFTLQKDTYNLVIGDESAYDKLTRNII